MATMSKRAQARTERELQDLLNVPGNSTCADCGARNPSWASWSLGIFLCMRCATIHRKLGTHISKVKSLSMDTWTNEQVESMKKNGNTAVNKIYNPTNKKPDMPLDADEVDNAMERFIRKKYQEKSLANGRPPVPSRDDPSTMRSRSPDIPPPTALPSKKGKFFGFGLRASSSAYPFSKNDKKKKDEPRVDGAFRIASEEYTSTSRSGGRTEMSDQDLQIKLGQLHDMGFTDNHMNTKMLKKADGDVGRAIEALVKLGPRDKPQRKRTPDIVIPDREPERSQRSAPSSAQISNNPFDQLDEPSKQTSFGISQNDQQQQQSTVINTNPWQNSTALQPNTGLEQSFAGMQIAQPLFPHNTGGYNPQMRNDPRYQQTLTPPVPSIPQQWSANTSPTVGTNPFAQQPLSSQSTGNNPYANHMHQTMPGFAPSTNPFFQQQMSTGSQQPSPSSLANPFGLPPSQSPPQPQAQPNLGQSSSVFDAPQQQNQGYQNQQYNQQPQYQPQSPVSSSPGFPNFQYGQPQAQNQYQYTQQVQQQQQQPQQNFTNVQSPYNNPYQQQQQPQALSPQQTGRYAKNDILALFNYPTLAPQKPLASIPEPTETQQQSQQQPEQYQTQFQPQQQQPPQQYQPHTRQPLSQAPSNIYSNPTNNTISQAKRSATMPISNPSNRNPFLQTSNSNTSSLASTPITSQFTQNPNSNPYHQQQYQQQLSQQQQNYDFGGSNNSGGLGIGVGVGNNNGYRHASADSVSVNNPNLLHGRHSPDAFASLSARSMR